MLDNSDSAIAFTAAVIEDAVALDVNGLVLVDAATDQRDRRASGTGDNESTDGDELGPFELNGCAIGALVACTCNHYASGRRQGIGLNHDAVGFARGSGVIFSGDGDLLRISAGLYLDRVSGQAGVYRSLNRRVTRRLAAASGVGIVDVTRGSLLLGGLEWEEKQGQERKSKKKRNTFSNASHTALSLGDSPIRSYAASNIPTGEGPYYAHPCMSRRNVIAIIWFFYCSFSGFVGTVQVEALVSFSRDQGRNERGGERCLSDPLESCSFEPSSYFIKRIASAMLGGQEHEHGEDRPYRRMG